MTEEQQSIDNGQVVHSEEEALPEWTQKYPEETRHFLKNFGLDDGGNPELISFNKTLIHLGFNGGSEWYCSPDPEDIYMEVAGYLAANE